MSPSAGKGPRHGPEASSPDPEPPGTSRGNPALRQRVHGRNLVSSEGPDLATVVKASTDIVDVVHAYVPLKRRGKTFEARCPFHEEKTPSFKVNPEGQFFKCFGCGKGGDCFSFVEEIERVSFREALEILAERAGISIRSGSLAGSGSRAREALKFARDYFAANLWGDAGRETRAYLSRRGIEESTARAFHLGAAPDAWTGLRAAAQSAGIPDKALLEAGLVVAREDGSGVYDRFRDRLVFAIHDGLNRPVGFGARLLGDGEPKYLNSPETPLFSKRRLLYGLEHARAAAEPTRALAVVEGYTDVLMAHQAGVQGVVATLGTSLTPDHAKLLRRHTDTVVLVFDGDAAGERAVERGVEALLGEDLDVRVVHLPAGEDPCDFVRSRGSDAFRDLLGESRDLFEEVVSRRGSGEAGTASRARAVDALLRWVAAVPSPVRRAEWLRRLAKEWLLSERDLRARLESFGRREEVPSPSPAKARTAADPRAKAEADLLRCCIQDPGALAGVRHAVRPEEFRTDGHREVYEALLESDDRGDRPEPGSLLLRLAGRTVRAEVAGWFETPLPRPAAVLRGALQYLRRTRAEEDVEAIAASAFATGGSPEDPAALEALHRRLREAKSLGR